MTVSEVAAALARLIRAFGQPFGASADDADGFRREWARALEDCEPQDVHQAIDEYVRQERKFPVPAVIRKRALDLLVTRRQRMVKHDPNPPFCAHCGTRDLYETPHGRFQPVHADGCRMRQRDQGIELRMAQEVNGVWYGGRDPKHIGRGAA